MHTNSKKIKILTAFILICFYIKVAAQPAQIASDRPGQTFSPLSIGKNNIQFQAGFEVFKQKHISNSTQIVLPNFFFRWGLSKKVELNTYLEYSTSTTKTNQLKYFSNGFSNTSIGARWNISEESKSKPAIGLLALLKIPHTNAVQQTHHIAPKIVASFSKSIFPKISFNTNWGAEWDGINNAAQGIYTLNLGYTVHSNLFVFIENYGNFTQQSWMSKWDAGFGYLINNQFQIDAAVGWNQQASTKESYISIGISKRILR